MVGHRFWARRYEVFMRHFALGFTTGKHGARIKLSEYLNIWSKAQTILTNASYVLSNLNWIGMQRCLDCESSPIAELQMRAAQQGWNTVFSLNEPDLNGISAQTAADWYVAHINPLAISELFYVLIGEGLLIGGWAGRKGYSVCYVEYDEWARLGLCCCIYFSLCRTGNLFNTLWKQAHILTKIPWNIVLLWLHQPSLVWFFVCGVPGTCGECP